MLTPAEHFYFVSLFSFILPTTYLFHFFFENSDANCAIMKSNNNCYLKLLLNIHDNIISGFKFVSISSLFYNASARHERHECSSATQATWVQHEWDISDTNAARVPDKLRHELHECETSKKFWFWWRHKWKRILTPLD